jgi:hypothetical protein
MTLGPQQMPPQGAKALIGALLGGRRRGAQVSATLDESQPDQAALEFINEGTGTAVALRCVVQDETGELSHQRLGNLPPGGTVRHRVLAARGGVFRCVWSCDDGRQGARRWSYDGHHKRVRRSDVSGDEAYFRDVYG